MIEELIKNKALEPYFFWLIKSRIKVAKTAVIVVFQEKKSDLKIAQSARNDCETSFLLLSIELIKLGVSQDHIPALINEISNYHLSRNSIKTILDSNPELFIFPKYKSN